MKILPYEGEPLDKGVPVGKILEVIRTPDPRIRTGSALAEVCALALKPGTHYHVHGPTRVVCTELKSSVTDVSHSNEAAGRGISQSADGYRIHTRHYLTPQRR